MRTLLPLLALAASVAGSGCIYANVQTPLAYRSPTPADVGTSGQVTGEEAQGEACNTLILGLVAWGDGGYIAAVENAKAASGAAILTDLRADTTFFNILSVYQKACTKVTGKVVKAAGAGNNT